jgi:hypothetical protein
MWPSCCPSADDRSPAGRARRRPFGGRGISARQAATADPQPFSETVTASSPFRSHHRRPLCAPHAPAAATPFRDRPEALGALQPPSSSHQAEISPAFSSDMYVKPGPKGPTQEVVTAVIDMKRRNPTWGCPRIAQQITLAFGIAINKDVVRRILAARHQPTPDSAGPSWLTALGHAKDSLWNLDLFHCESAVLRSHWVACFPPRMRCDKWLPVGVS